MAGLLWMYQECTHELAEQRKSICEQFKPEDLQATSQFIQAHAEDFVIEFYQQMLLEEHATEFLSAEMVKNRLKNSLYQWLISSFEVPFQHNRLLALVKF